MQPFSKNRPYILLEMISTDKKLKKAMKKVFTNSKVNNDLSKELNINIFLVSQFFIEKFNKFKYYNLLQRVNIYDISVTFSVLKLDKSKYSNSLQT